MWYVWPEPRAAVWTQQIRSWSLQENLSLWNGRKNHNYHREASTAVFHFQFFPLSVFLSCCCFNLWALNHTFSMPRYELCQQINTQHGVLSWGLQLPACHSIMVECCRFGRCWYSSDICAICAPSQVARAGLKITIKYHFADKSAHRFFSPHRRRLPHFRFDSSIYSLFSSSSFFHSPGCF